MVRFASLVVLVGCYAPSAIEGGVCGVDGACPSGQDCDLATNRCTSVRVDARSTDGGSPGAFVDDFSRGSGEAIGNGWIEKGVAPFFLAANAVARRPTMVSYRDNMVYRPASEDLLDVEISMRVRFTEATPGYAQLFVRASSHENPDSYDGYLLYVEGDLTNELVLGRQIGSVFVETLRRFTIAEPFETMVDYRFVLGADGTSPVRLHARVERLDGTLVTLLGETSFADNDPRRIALPGTVGFSGDERDSYVYDQFTRDPL